MAQRQPTSAELRNSVDLLWSTTNAELHNSVNLHCGTKAAEPDNAVWCIQQESHTFSKNSEEPCWKMWVEGLIQSKINGKLLKDERFERFSKQCNAYAFWRQNSRPQQTFERWAPRAPESPSELARQSEAKRKQAPQSEAKMQSQKTSLINCTEHPIMHRTPTRN